MRERKGMDLDVRRDREDQGRLEGGRNVNRIYCIKYPTVYKEK